MKKMYYVVTNGYDMLVCVDTDNNCWYLTETEEFPVLSNMDETEKREVVRNFMATIEDHSSWDTDCTYDHLFSRNIEDILAKVDFE